jgi:hypothetical protein
MRELTPKGKKIVRLAVILGVVIFAGIVYWAVQARKSPDPSGNGTTIFTETPKGFTGRLPYISDGFTIDYLASDDTYIVNIYEEPVEELKAAATRFLSKNGAQTPPSKIEFFLGPDVSEHVGP